MNILVIAKKLPYPLEDGASIRIYHILKYLSQRHKITLLVISRSNKDSERVQFIERFCDSILLIPLDNNVAKKSFNFLLSLFSRIPYTVLANTSKALKQRILEILKSGKIDFIQVEELYLANNVPTSEYQRMILSTYNIEHQILDRIAKNAPLYKKLYYSDQALMMKAFEKEVGKASRAIFTVSKVDERYYHNINSETFLAPNGVDKLQVLNNSRKRQILLTGSLAYYPNVEGIKYFLSKIYPLILDLELEVVIVGRNPATGLTMFESPKVKFLVNEDSIDEHFNDSMMLCVPLQSGGGTKLKVLQAFSHGLPVVTTSIGAEGLDIIEGKHALIGDSPELFAAQIRCLSESPHLREDLARNAIKLVEEKYLWQNCLSSMSNYYI